VRALDEELAQLGGDLAEALEDVPLPGILLDSNGVMRWQNKASLTCRGNAIGGNFVDYVAPGEQPEARAIVRRILCQGVPAEFRVHMRTAAGEYTSLELSAVPVRGGSKVVGVFGLSRSSRGSHSTVSKSHFALTQRQREVLGLLADGRSTQEMATELHLSETTVRNHVANVLAILGVHTRLQAVVVASRAGLLET
jgi:DNA-binding CsgD family transcriptional regulator